MTCASGLRQKSPIQDVVKSRYLFVTSQRSVKSFSHLMNAYGVATVREHVAAFKNLSFPFHAEGAREVQWGKGLAESRPLYLHLVSGTCAESGDIAALEES